MGVSLVNELVIMAETLGVYCAKIKIKADVKLCDRRT